MAVGLITGTMIYARDGILLKVSGLKCENFVNPIGIDITHPRLSWQITSERRNVLQSAYRILVSEDPDKLASGVGEIWDSKKVKSDQSILIRYDGNILKSSTIYYWKVMVWDNSENASEWSETAAWQTGLLSHTDWKGAEWICFEDMPASMRIVPGIHGNGNDLGNKGLQRPVIPYFRKAFSVSKKIKSATLYISGLGQYDAWINGNKAGKAFLAPGWTDYDKTIFYNTYDVTGYLQHGENVIGAIVGNGFNNIDRERYRKLVIAFGTPKMICRLQIRYADGSTENIISDSSWKTSSSPVTYTSIYGGEDYDGRLEQAGWNETGFDDSCWKDVIIAESPRGTLKPETDYPVAVMDTIVVKDLYRISDDRYLYDFGQNVSGIFEISVSGKKGQVIRLLPGELINNDKTINQNATGKWHYYTYTLNGERVETWQPKFTYYGFRYMQVEGAVSESDAISDSLPAIVELKMLHTRNSSPPNGTFECSDKLFNSICHLINEAVRSNLQSVLTDCPHREKLGWLEQTYLMGSSVNYNFDIYHLCNKLIRDMEDAQTAEGLIPSIAPEYVLFEGAFRDSPEWGSASVIMPWLIYKWYGDPKVMEEAWPMMVRYVEYLSDKAEDHILAYGLGDWYDLGPQRPGFAQLTPVSLTATATYYYDLKLLSEMAELLGKTNEENNYAEQAELVRTAFNNKFFDKDKMIYATGSQTAMAMPLCMGIVESKYRDKVFLNLVDSIDLHDKALTAGDIGFHYLVKALTEGGASQLLFDMNNRDDVPGYGYQLKKGATALTESWQALESVSNNHLMLGHLMEWFYNGLGGIRQEVKSAGFRNIVIKPATAVDLSHVKTDFNSPYGIIHSEWKISNGNLYMDIRIPANTTAEIYIPSEPGSQIFENNTPISQIKEIRFLREENGYTVLKAGSGSYKFMVVSKKQRTALSLIINKEH